MSSNDRVLPAIVAAVVALAVSATAAADAVSVAGRVLGETGSPLAEATVSLQDTNLAVNSNGGFSFQLDSPTAVLLRVEAPGYYPFLHTLHRSDFVNGREAIVPDIHLVQRHADRRLLLFAGDAMLSRRYFEPRAGEPVLVRRDSVLDDGRKLFEPIRPYIELADFASVNMETQLSATPLTNRVPKSVTFYSPDELATLLQWAGFDYVALGNNHMYDYRDVGLASTFAALANTRLAYSGAGTEDRAARQAARVEIGGREHRFLSYVGWAGTFEPSQVATANKGGATLGNTEIIAEDLAAVPDSSISILQLHAGLEYAETPALSEQTTLRQAIKDGADVAVGHHPHVLQGFEIVDDRLIAYSLGNFLFDQYHYATHLGMLLYVWMDGDVLHRAEAVPLHVNGYVPTPATGLFRHAILTRLARLSASSVCMMPSGFHAVMAPCRGAGKPTATVAISPSADATPLHLRSLGVSPLQAVRINPADGPYRLGTDLLRRGDFEYARLFGAHDRSWIVGRNVSLKTGDNNSLEIRLPAGAPPVRTGMKVFERVFSPSSPATFSGRLRADGDVRFRLLLQRRREADTLDEALAVGPITQIGVWEGSADDWTPFSFDYTQPRVATRSVRLLMEFDDISGDKSGAKVALDDLAWVEWKTPWIGPGDEADEPVFATHLMFRRTSKP